MRSRVRVLVSVCVHLYSTHAIVSGEISRATRLSADAWSFVPSLSGHQRCHLNAATFRGRWQEAEEQKESNGGFLKWRVSTKPYGFSTKIVQTYMNWRPWIEATRPRRTREWWQNHGTWWILQLLGVQDRGTDGYSMLKDSSGFQATTSKNPLHSNMHLHCQFSGASRF